MIEAAFMAVKWADLPSLNYIISANSMLKGLCLGNTHFGMCVCVCVCVCVCEKE